MWIGFGKSFIRSSWEIGGLRRNEWIKKHWFIFSLHKNQGQMIINDYDINLILHWVLH